MIRITEAMNEKDRAHLRRILQATAPSSIASTQLMEAVEEFVRDFTYVDDAALFAFRDMDQGTRERLLSALVWRITCFIDGSVTSVKGVRAHDVGAGFLAVQARHEGREVFCLRQI